MGDLHAAVDGALRDLLEVGVEGEPTFAPVTGSRTRYGERTGWPDASNICAVSPSDPRSQPS